MGLCPRTWWAHNLKAILGIEEEIKLKKIREAHLKLASLMGAKPGVLLTQEEFVKAVAMASLLQMRMRAGSALWKQLMLYLVC